MVHIGKKTTTLAFCIEIYNGKLPLTKLVDRWNSFLALTIAASFFLH